jgi:heat shock protein HtpX
VFVLLLVMVGAAFTLLFRFGWIGIVVALVVAGALAFTSYWNSDKVALAVTHAKPADPQEYARLHNLVEGLCISSGLPMPRLYVIEDPAPNAFATGRNPKHAAIAVTSGLLEKMNRIELEGVLAHELSHVKNYDILVSTLAVVMVGAIALLSDIGMRFMIFGGRRNDSGGGSNPLVAIIALVFLALAPLAAVLLQFSVGRRRESLADMSAVEMTRYPPGLISALQKLRDDQTVVRSGSNRATAHLWIEEPMDHYQGKDKRRSKWSHAFDTHPPIDDRIAALREL